MGDGNPDVISCRGVEKSYTAGSDRLEVLRGIDLKVGSGESVAVLGRSGSGKSTLLHVISGLDRPDRGEVFIEGIGLSTLSSDQLAALRLRKIGFIFQFFNLLPNLTLLANVELPLMLTDLPDEDIHSRAYKMLRFVGLEERGNHYPSELSGGEQQRGAIARALISNPRVVMADEPTGNLDAETGKRVLELIATMKRDLGQTTIFATHDPQVADLADRVLTLEGGSLKPTGRYPT